MALVGLSLVLNAFKKRPVSMGQAVRPCIDKKSGGLSLVEVIVALGVTGIFITTLLMSSAYFSGRLLETRERMKVIHSASQMINRLANELSLTPRILEGSSSYFIFAYYDPIRQQAVTRKYELVTSGSNKFLQKSEYSSGAWVVGSPYSTEASSGDLAIDPSATFAYCSGSDCAVSATQALAVKLSSWSFYKTASPTRPLALPTDLMLYLSSGQVGEVLVSEKPRGLFYASAANAFGAGSSVLLTAVSPNTGMLMNANSSTITRVTGTLDNFAPSYTITAMTGGSDNAIAQDTSNELYVVNIGTTTLDRHTYNEGSSAFTQTTSLNYSAHSGTVMAVAIDQNSSGAALLDRTNKQIDIFADRTVSGAPAAPTSFSLAALTAPSGMAVSDRTGDYLVVDSTVTSSTIPLKVYDGSTGTLEQTITIDVSAANLGVNLSAETNFKIGYNAMNNVLYLFAPNVGYVVALTMPSLL